MAEGQDLEPEPGPSLLVSARALIGTLRDKPSDPKRRSLFELRRTSSEVLLKRPHSAHECPVPLSPANEVNNSLEEKKADRNRTVRKLLLRNDKQVETAKRRASLFALNKLVLAFKSPWTSKDQGGPAQQEYTEEQRDHAALQIQTRFRGHRARKIYKMAVKRGHEVAELAQTEDSYVRVLTDLVKRYKHALERIVGQETHRHLPVTAQDITDIFANIENILAHHKGLLQQLEEAIEGYHIDSCIGNVLKDLGDEKTVNMYTTFIQNRGLCERTLDRLMQDKHFRVWLQEREVLRGTKGCIKTLLGNVFQRVMRYQMVLQSLAKHTPENHPDYDPIQQALNSAQGLALQVDWNMDKARKAEQLVASLHGFIQSIGKDELMERQDEVEEIRDGKFKGRNLVLLSRHLVCLERKPVKLPKRPATPTTPSTPSKKTRWSSASTPQTGRLARTPSKGATRQQQDIPSGMVKWCLRLDEVDVSESNTTPGSPLGKVVDRTLVLTVLKGSEILSRRILVFETDSQRHFWADLIRQAKTKATQTLSRQSSMHSQGSMEGGDQPPGRSRSFRAWSGRAISRTASAMGLASEASPPSPHVVVRRRHGPVRSTVLLDSSGSMDHMSMPPSPLATPRLGRLVCAMEPELAHKLDDLMFTRHQRMRELDGLTAMHKLYEAQAQREGRELRDTEKRALAQLDVQTAEVQKILESIDEDIKLIYTVGPIKSPGIRSSVFFAADFAADPSHMTSSMA